MLAKIKHPESLIDFDWDEGGICMYESMQFPRILGRNPFIRRQFRNVCTNAFVFTYRTNVLLILAEVKFIERNSKAVYQIPLSHESGSPL